MTSENVLHIRLVIEGLGEPYYVNCFLDPLIARVDLPTDPERIIYRTAEEMKRRLGDELLKRLEEVTYG